MGTNAAGPLHFGPFELDPRAGQLRREGAPVRIQEKPLRLLEALLARPGELVTREELRTLLWPADTFVDFEGGLNTAVNKVRSALGDSADNPRFVETVGRRGYRFAAPVETVLVAPPSSAPPGSPASARTGRTRRWPIALAVAIALGATAALWLARRELASADAAVIRSLAVLPFANFSASRNEEYFADGMTDTLITDLASIRSLRVIARQSVMRYKGSREPVRKIARELGVDAVVEGSVVRHGGRVRLTAQLIRASDESHLWARNYDRELDDLLDLQAEVARAIADEVRAVVTPHEEARFERLRGVDPEAYDHYLRGRYLFHRRSAADARESLFKAVRHFEQAIAKNPGFALAHAGLAETWGPLGYMSHVRPEEALVPMRENAERALALDGDLTEAHTAMAACLAFHEWDWEGAEREFARAIELDPRYSTARLWYGFYLESIGRQEENLQQRRMALEDDPFHLTSNASLGAAFSYLGRYDEAIAQLEKTIELEDDARMARGYLAMVYVEQGRLDEAIAEYQRAGHHLGAARTAALAGRPGEARAMLAALAERARREYVSPLHFASLHAALGDKDAAFGYLDEAFRTRAPALSHVKTDPVWKALRSDSRFADLLRRMRLL